MGNPRLTAFGYLLWAIAFVLTMLAIVVLQLSLAIALLSMMSSLPILILLVIWVGAAVGIHVLISNHALIALPRKAPG